jgi:hypothetical protein
VSGSDLPELSSPRANALRDDQSQIPAKENNPIKLIHFPINKSENVDNVIRKFMRKFDRDNLLQK